MLIRKLCSHHSDVFICDRGDSIEKLHHPLVQAQQLRFKIVHSSQFSNLVFSRNCLLTVVFEAVKQFEGITLSNWPNYSRIIHTFFANASSCQSVVVFITREENQSIEHSLGPIEIMRKCVYFTIFNIVSASSDVLCIHQVYGGISQDKTNCVCRQINRINRNFQRTKSTPHLHVQTKPENFNHFNFPVMKFIS